MNKLSKGHQLVEAIRGKATIKMTTDEILEMTRGTRESKCREVSLDKWAFFDLDDTINDLKFMLMGALRLRTGKLIPTTEWSQYSVPQYGLSQKELLKIMDETNILTFAEPNKFFSTMVRTYKDLDYKIGIITARKCFKPKKKIDYVTASWLATNQIPYDLLLICDHGEKGDLLKASKLNVELFMDDNLGNCMDVLKKVRDAQVFIRDQPWNQGNLPMGITRIKERG